MIAALLTTILFSISVICGHRSAKMLGGMTANFWRLSCATLLLGIWAFVFGIGLKGAAFPLFFLSGVIGIGFGDVALFEALPRLGSRLSILLIQCLTAPFGALIEWVWLHNRLSPLQIISGLTILVGVGVALTPAQHIRIPRRDLVWGTVASVLAALGGACGAVISRKAYDVVRSHAEHIDGANAAFQRIIGGLLIATTCLVLVKRGKLLPNQPPGENGPANPGPKRWKAVAPWVVANAVAGQTLGVSCMQRAFETTPTGIVLPIIAMTPIVVIPFAWVFEGERPTRHSLLGAIIAVAGAIALTCSR